jgi:hypothetical protein
VTQERAIITPVRDAETNSTNGFTFGKQYPARREGTGWRVINDNGHSRFIGPDGGGGAHLCWRSGDSYLEAVRTTGHFEIEVLPAPQDPTP